jgi:hypothetical protein
MGVITDKEFKLWGSDEKIATGYQKWVESGKPETGHGVFRRIWDFLSALLGNTEAKQRRVYRGQDTGLYGTREAQPMVAGEAQPVIRRVNPNLPGAPGPQGGPEPPGVKLPGYAERIGATVSKYLSTTRNMPLEMFNAFQQKNAEQRSSLIDAQYLAHDYTKAMKATGASVTEADKAHGWHTRLFSLMPAPLSRLAGAILYPHMA